jgi:hypothetical protein
MRPVYVAFVVTTVLWLHAFADSSQNHCRITRTAPDGTPETVPVDWWVLLTGGSGSETPHQLWYKEGNNAVAEVRFKLAFVPRGIFAHCSHRTIAK